MPILAKSFDIDINKLNESSARELLHNAFKIHYYSGTFYALNKALKTFSNKCEVKEWFSYNAQPYHFKLIFKVSNTGLTQSWRNLGSAIGDTFLPLSNFIANILSSVAKWLSQLNASFSRLSAGIVSVVAGLYDF
ncbi:phage tail protein I [Campylobacter anatolicus]|uniref:phage tail protein I n=1 Tax=Campylobacter anatolicus TaxID=2829105 RepID=UPI0030B815BF